ncbi:hypothetical protein FRC12_009649 [Ceratobasidium sp. 428]|nr:hypothetical protein FRC12_009649 [Ceratobasidium sp. 428]
MLRQHAWSISRQRTAFALTPKLRGCRSVTSSLCSISRESINTRKLAAYSSSSGSNLSPVSSVLFARNYSVLPNTSPSKLALARTFDRIESSDVYVSYPPKELAIPINTSVRAPAVILICGWMDAHPTHLYKYTEKYNQLYPSATQILVRSHQSYYWKGSVGKKASVFPAVKLFEDLDVKPGSSPESSGLLVHAFSNGGAVTLTSLAHHLSKTKSQQPPALPAQALILDSLPGIVDLRVATLAFTAPIRSPIARTLAKLYYGTLYFGNTFWHRIILQDKQSTAFFGRIHEDLNDPNLLPQHIPRTYMYSNTDQLVQPKVVESHAEKTKQHLEALGKRSDIVRLVKFEGSQHVSHARLDPGRYWEAVTRTWEASYRKL